MVQEMSPIEVQIVIKGKHEFERNKPINLLLKDMLLTSLVYNHDGEEFYTVGNFVSERKIR